MKRPLVVVVAAALMLAAAPRQERGGTDKVRLQGTWRLAAVELNKQPIVLESLKEGDVTVPGMLTVKADHYSFRLGKTRLEITYKMNPDAKPKAIDLTVMDGPQKGQVYRGIYRLEGDTYTICRHIEPGKERPTEFKTKADSGLMLVVWKRDKPG
jgi:uncharacterized protein (TIGR03067 family)